MKREGMSALERIERDYPLVLTTRQVCEILQLSRHTFYKVVAAGTIAPLPLRGVKAHRFSRESVLSILRGA